MEIKILDFFAKIIDRPSWTIQASFSHNQGPFHWKIDFCGLKNLKDFKQYPILINCMEILSNNGNKWVMHFPLCLQK